MNKHIVLASLLATGSAFAANFGGTTTTPPASSGTVTASAASVVIVPPTASGPQAADLFRVFKKDGATMIQQGSMTANAGSIPVITVSEADALSMGVGKCAFNVKYDEVSATAAVNTTNRLFSNDKVIAINSLINLSPGVIKTIWTQPYLFSGMNTVRVVVNADGVAPSTKLIRINVMGACGGVSAATTTSTAATTSTTVTTTTTTTTTLNTKFGPGTAEWNNLNVVFGYSNYGVTQLKNKNYPRYAELVKLNTAITVVINAKSVERGAYNSLMTSWNTFVTDPVFKAMMSATVPGTSGK